MMPRPPASPSPPPAPFAFMSGSFDYPHATSSPLSPREPSPSPPRHPQRERANTAANGLLPPARDPQPGRRGGHGRPVRRAQLERLRRSDPPGTTTAADRQPVPASATTRPRATPSQRYLRRPSVSLRGRPSHSTDTPPSVAPFMANPFTTLERLRSARDEPEPARRQAKRRKLQHDPTPVSPWDGFKYGYKGQVVPTRLKMEIVSCDGGEYEKDTAYGLYPIQNVLKNDKSVYCSERSRCNLLLKHIGGMPFTLEKVVIRAPDRGFTAPVQEGLVFVAMSSEDLLSGTSKYNIEYDTPSPPLSERPTPPSSVGDELLSLQEAIADPYLDMATLGRMDNLELQERLDERRRNMVEYLGRAARVHRQNRLHERQGTVVVQEDVLAESCEDPEDDLYAAIAGVSAPTPPPFTVLNESGDDSDDNEEMPSPAILADRLRRESRWRSEGDDEDDDDFPEITFPPLRRPPEIWDSSRLRSERHLDPIRATQRHTPSRIGPDEASPESTRMIAPHAKFFIEKHKNKITIKFHPAISGKFVLLKLWSPSLDGNIDIETVQFYGYSGPRFFPATQPR